GATGDTGATGPGSALAFNTVSASSSITTTPTPVLTITGVPVTTGDQLKFDFTVQVLVAPVVAGPWAVSLTVTLTTSNDGVLLTQNYLLSDETNSGDQTIKVAEVFAQGSPPLSVGSHDFNVEISGTTTNASATAEARSLTVIRFDA
ncbi:hypothetical protein, partial [Priestia megaterium]|uniref:hypothetical protein n=1 Tax=Priestia megaterium TaxID=1404 RepID=UPI002DCFC8B4|nr:hypothetical protein [Priestia megaterium]